MRLPRAAAAALAFGAALGGSSGRADAYVRYKADGGVEFAWPQSCIAIASYPSDFVSMMPMDEIENAENGAAAAWSTGGSVCVTVDIAITVTPSTGPTPRAVNDGVNNLIFRTANWCLLLADGTCDPTSTAYDSSALALTSVSASTRTGAIKDADIEINGFHSWADLVAHPELFTANPSLQDLQNALTHEMGHLIGLDHTCVPAGTVPRPVDNLGNPVPDCDKAPPDVVATTMFPSADPGDTGKRTLAPDDQQAVCDIYPSSNPKPCMAPPDPSSSGCACAAAATRSPTGRLPAGIGLGAILVLRARRRHKR